MFFFISKIIFSYFIRLLPVTASALLLFSCQDVINVNLNNASPQLVIEGSISNQPDTVMVSLSRTTDYFSPGTIAPVTDATVSIFDSAGNSFQPTVSTDGNYLFLNLKGTPGKTYTLKVEANGSEYVASSQMPNVVEIDSLQVLKATDGDKENDLYIYIHDPVNVANYYRVRIYRNGVLLTRDFINPIILFNDKYFDGRNTPLTISSRRFGLVSFLPSDVLRVQLMSIDQVTYFYFRELRDLTGLGRGFSTSTPDNPDNNISNGALGYFAAWSIDEKTIVVQQTDQSKP